ncbi:MAG: histidine kinase [Gemmatimonadaceae bacterium]|nr:histidine kinase [Gemmatimonadaceae bacterium]
MLPWVLIVAVLAFILWRLSGVSAETADFYARPVASTVQTQAGMVESRLALARRDAAWLGTLLIGRMADSVERARLLSESEFVALRVRNRDGRTLLDVHARTLPDGGVRPGGTTTVPADTTCLLVVGAVDPTGAGREIVAWIRPTDRLMGRIMIVPNSQAEVAQTSLFVVSDDSVHVLSAPGGRYFSQGQSFSRATMPRLVRYAVEGREMPAYGPALDGTEVIVARAPVAGTSIVALRALNLSAAVRTLRLRLARDLGIALLLGVLGVAALVAGVRERRTHELETALLAARLEALQQHLRPHFLFNALTAIGELAHTAPDRAEAATLHLSELLRESLALAPDAVVPLERELSLLDAYLAVERERFGAALDVRVDVPVALRETGVLPWTLQPLVENALKHGARPCTVTISTHRAGERVTLRVVNRRAADTSPRGGTGVGLANLRDRVAAVFGTAGAVRVLESDELFTVEVDVPSSDALIAVAA